MPLFSSNHFALFVFFPLEVEKDMGCLGECEIAALIVFQHLAYNSIGHNPVRVKRETCQIIFTIVISQH